MALPNTKVPMRALFKRFAWIYLPVAVGLSLILYFAIRFDQQLRVQNTVMREGSRIEVARERMTQDLAAVDTDLRVIANLPLLRDYLDSGNPAQRDDLEQVFLELSQEMQRYDQIRYVNANGQEIIRVDYNGGKPAIVPRDRLQYKSGRYYFSDTIKLKPGEIYVSPLDLNIENDRLEIPYKPMIRYGTPVFDDNGRKKGVILLNYFGTKLLQHFRAAMAGGEPRSGMLLNRDGYWLAGGNPEDTWGFMLGKTRRTFGHDHPRAWRTISTSGHGYLLTGQGLFVYSTVYPLRDELLPPGAPATTQALDGAPARARACDWKIVSFFPEDALFGTAFYNQPPVRILLFVIYLLLAAAAFFAAFVTLSRKRAREEIVKLNIELEQRVEERTAGEEKLSVTLNSIGDAVMATDAEGRITRLNTIAERLTGWTEEEARGRAVDDIFRIVNQETRLPVTIPVMATLALGTIQGLANHTVLIARDGAEYPIADSCAPIRARDGAIIGAILVFRDVTEEYAAQTALRDSATRIRTILDTVADSIITIDAQGTVETFNPAAENLFGYTAAEIVGQNIKTLMPEPYHSLHDAYLAHYLTTGEAHIVGMSRDVVGQRKNGSTFPMYLAVNEMELSGTPHFTGIVRDLTERRQSEQALVQAKVTAEQANRAKDSFLATMSHDIRTPLTGMLGMLEVLSMTALDPDQTATLDAAWDSARSLLRIVSDILDWSKIEEGKLALSPQPTSIPQLLQAVVNTYSRVASIKSLILRQHADARLSAAHIVDPWRLSQILNNFVSNAIKFTPHGEIELRAELLEQLESGERIRFSVKDSGIGIAREVQHNLFRRFQQESADTARLYGGTGLGLSICRRLAELLDGSIDLVSEPGHGATFSITLILPVSAAPGEHLPEQTPVMERNKVQPLLVDAIEAPQVLAVDDHPINRDLLARQIRLLGLRAETAENGEAALAMWRDGHFALVITDCHMPEMDGYTFAQTVRGIEAEQKLSHTPIIAWTANTRAEEETHCRDAGMDELLVKPVNLAQLKKMLAKWLLIAETSNGAHEPSVPDSAEPNPSQPIDYAELGKTVADSAEHTSVLTDFQSAMREDRASLGAKVEQGDGPEIKRAAHRMKGACRMVGATRLAAACATMEVAAGAADMDGVHAALATVDDAIEELEHHLQKIKVLGGGTNET